MSRFKIKINYDGTDYSEALKQNKEDFIKEHELRDNELAKILIYSMPIALGDTDVSSFLLLLNTYERYLQIKELLDRQGLITMSASGTMIVNKLLNSEKNYSQLLMQQLRSFGLTQDSRIGLESEKLQQQVENEDPVLQLIGELKELKE